MPKKKLPIILGAVLLFTLAATAVGLLLRQNGDDSNGPSAATSINVDYLSKDFSLENATYVNSDNGQISIDGPGASAKNQALYIENKGVYVLRGDFADGITINAAKAAVYLVLDGANVTNDNGACIYAQKVDTLYLASTKDTTNTLADGENYTEDYGLEDVDAAVYSKGNIALLGNGKIEILSNHYHGIHSKDYLQVLDGEYVISAVRNGLMGKDYVAINGGTLNITSGNDGIKSNNDSDTKLGYIVIDGGKISVVSDGDAIQAETRISITDGDFNLATGGGAKNTSTSYQDWGKWGNARPSVNSESNSSAKGIKSDKYIYIGGGDFTFDTSDDAIHSNTNIVIDGGNISVKSGDDGIHADSTLTINGGTIDIAQSYEGLEATEITINDGDIKVIASDDGINAAGGKDSSSIGNRPGRNNFGKNSVGALTINGGTVYINANGDGLDSNNSITMTGGYVTIDGPTSNGDSAIDHDGNFLISGGTLIAAGSSGMLELPSADSEQNTISIVFSSVRDANSEFALKDSQGNIIVSHTPSKQYASIVISSPKIASGASYEAFTGNSSYATIKVTSPVTSYGSSGGMMPGGGPGKRR